METQAEVFMNLCMALLLLNVVNLQKSTNENLETVRETINVSFKNGSGVKMNYTLLLSAQCQLERLNIVGYRRCVF